MVAVKETAAPGALWEHGAESADMSEGCDRPAPVHSYIDPASETLSSHLENTRGYFVSERQIPGSQAYEEVFRKQRDGKKWEIRKKHGRGKDWTPKIQGKDRQVT